MNDKLKDAATDLLFSAILSLRTVDECYAFFEDICTIAELKSLTQRLHVAMMLQQRSTYTEICDETGVSTATISRVNRSLEYGADGYKTVLDRLAAAGLYPDAKTTDGRNEHSGRSSSGLPDSPHQGTRKD